MTVLLSHDTLTKKCYLAACFCKPHLHHLVLTPPFPLVQTRDRYREASGSLNGISFPSTVRQQNENIMNRVARCRTSRLITARLFSFPARSKYYLSLAIPNVDRSYSQRRAVGRGITQFGKR
jgi:hypothetical protein